MSAKDNQLVKPVLKKYKILFHGRFAEDPIYIEGMRVLGFYASRIVSGSTKSQATMKTKENILREILKITGVRYPSLELDVEECVAIDHVRHSEVNSGFTFYTE